MARGGRRFRVVGNDYFVDNYLNIFNSLKWAAGGQSLHITYPSERCVSSAVAVYPERAIDAIDGRFDTDEYGFLMPEGRDFLHLFRELDRRGVTFDHKYLEKMNDDLKRLRVEWFTEDAYRGRLSDLKGHSVFGIEFRHPTSAVHVDGKDCDIISDCGLVYRVSFSARPNGLTLRVDDVSTQKTGRLFRLEDLEKHGGGEFNGNVGLTRRDGKFFVVPRAVSYSDYSLGMQGDERICCRLFENCLINNGGLIDSNIVKLEDAENLLLGLSPLEILPEREETAETS